MDQDLYDEFGNYIGPEVGRHEHHKIGLILASPVLLIVPGHTSDIRSTSQTRKALMKRRRRKKKKKWTRATEHWGRVRQR